MGTFLKGILGGFSGKVGTVVGANWRGKNVMRSLPTPSNREPSALQVAQRMRFSTVMRFLTPLKPMVGELFGEMRKGLSPFNQAVSYHLREGLVLVADEFVINFPEVLISKGDLTGLQMPTAAAGGPNIVQLDWQDNSNQGLAAADDELFVALYAPEEELYEMFFQETTRDAESASLELPLFFGGLEVEVWATFVSASGAHIATSNYLGAVTVP